MLIDLQSGGIGKLFGKIFRRKSKGKEKHVEIQDNKPKRSKSKTLKKKKDTDSDKTTWPDAEDLELVDELVDDVPQPLLRKLQLHRAVRVYRWQSADWVKDVRKGNALRR